MISFAQLLTQYRVQRDLSIQELADYTGLNSSTIYKITQGKRMPADRKTVALLARCLCLSKKEASDFFDSYYYSTLGEEKFYGFQQILRLLDTLPYAENPKYINRSHLEPLPAAPGSDTCLHGDREIWSCIQTVSAEAAERGESSIRFFFTDWYDIYPWAVAKSLEKNPQIRHDIIFVIDRNNIPDLNSHLHNLDLIAALMPLLYHYPNCRVHGLYADLPTIRSLSPLYLNRVMTGHAAVMFNQDASEGFLIQDERKLPYFRKVFSELVSGSSPLADYYAPETLFELLHSLLNNSHPQPISCYFESGIDTTMVLTPGEHFVEKHLLLPEPEKSDLIEKLHAFLVPQKRLYTDPQLRIKLRLFTKQGVLDFIHTGYTNEMPEKFMSPLSVQERIEILQIWQSLYERDLYTMVDLPSIQGKSPAWYILSKQSLEIQYTMEQFQYLSFEIRETSTVMLFHRFFEFISTEFRMERQEVLDFYRDCFSWLREQEEEESREN